MKLKFPTSDTGNLVIPDDATALVLDKNGHPNLVVTLPDGDDAEVPWPVLFLTAVMIRMKDHDCVQEMVREFEEEM